MLLPTWNALKVLFECHRSLLVPGRIHHPLHICHYLLGLPSLRPLPPRGRSTGLPLHPPLSPVSLYRTCRGAGALLVGLWRGCSAAAEGRDSPSSGSYSAVGPDQGWPPDIAGRRVGQRGSRHRRSGRSSPSGERAGPGKSRERDAVRSSHRPTPLACSCSHTCPEVLHLHRHLLNSSVPFQASDTFSMTPSLT